MSTTQHTCYSVACDRCKNVNDFEHDFTPHFPSAAEAIDEAESCGWVLLADGRLLCEDCIKALLAAGEIERNNSDDDDAPPYRMVAAAPATEDGAL
ncbi:hypothetical protein [Streptantibioticus silvisoli]|uniref:HNH endonuclease n=1 Tax=Streptantibioticus silvisoli TaxID=2705255 RepID=A0ABT6W4Y0_9ACTN|nr:hypothetical protein [Streptantibioticus silvisoli]MDI5965818.1 hypothetical protein [Streptantibioticus silvisoli]